MPGALIVALKAAPAIATAAAGLVKAIRGDNSKSQPPTTKNAEKAIKGIRIQLQQMRAHSEQQAEVVSQVAVHVETLSNVVNDTVSELSERVDSLKNHSEAQAEVVSQMATQVETLSDSVRFLSRRISLMNLSLLGSSMVAVTALILVILWS